MSEKSSGVKGKPPDKKDMVASESSQIATKEKTTASNSNENATLENQKVEPKVSDKAKESRRVIDTKSSMKVNGIKSGGTRPRRDEERRYYPPPKSSGRGRYESKVGSYHGSTSASSPRSDSKRTGDSSRYFSDESRLSKYIRRVVREGDRERRLTAAKQFKDYLRTGEGSKAAAKIADDILAALQDIFYERTSRELKLEIAACVGIVGGSMGHDAQRYFHWLFDQTNNVIEDDIKSLFLDSLLEALKYDEKKQAVGSLMPMVMTNVQTLLENADTPELLISVINVILHIAKHYQHVFDSHFRDTVDILVGWHIDSTQKDTLINFTSSALIEFHTFWVMDLSFSITLLGQFLEDMEAYAEDLTYSGSDHAYEEDCVCKISALLKVFTTVVKSLGDSLHPGNSSQITREYIVEVLDRIVKSVEIVVKNYFSESVLVTANRCVCLLVHQLQTDVVHSSCLLSFILTQTGRADLVSYKYIHSLLTTIQKVVEMYGIQLTVTFLSQLLAPGSLLQQCRFSQSEEVVEQLMALYHDIMALKSVPLLEEAYKFIVGDLQRAYNLLLLEAKERKMVDLIPDNPFKSTQYTILHAQTVCVFNLCALAEIGNTKNNLIAMWALSPSIFDLIGRHFDPLELSVAERYPAIQYAILNALFSHCTRHGNFISSSSLLTQNSYKEGSVLANVSPTTSNNFSRILRLLTGLLASNSTSYDSRCLCLKWIGDIISGLNSSTHIFSMDNFVVLIRVVIHLGHSQDLQVTMSICQCLQNVFKMNNNLPSSVMQRSVKLSVYKLTDNRAVVREAFFKLLKLLPVNITTRLTSLLHLCDDSDQAVSLQEGAEGVTAAWLAKRCHMNKIPSGGFHSLNFRHVMAFILHNKQPVQSGSWNWLEAMFYSCQSSTPDPRHSSDSFNLRDFVDGNEGMLWFWATWEAAQYCILNRLRTPLGKPQETFTSIEGVIKTVAIDMLSHLQEDTDKSKGDQKKGEKNGDLGCHLRVQLLLSFMEQLEKLLYNAYEGCAAAMPMAPKVVRTFFRTNKATCLEWLSRIRSNIIKIALHAGMPAMAVRQAHELLRDMKENNNTQTPEFEQTLVYLVQALCDLKQADAVSGLYTWCKDLTSKKLSLIKAAVEKASGRYESAAAEFKSVLKTMLTTDGSEEWRVDDEGGRATSELVMPKRITGILSKQTAQVQQTQHQHDSSVHLNKLNLVVNQVVDCYQRLGDWESVLEWQDQVVEYRQDTNLSDVQSAFKTDVDINYIKALSSFEHEDYVAVRENLELVPGVSDISKADKAHTPQLWSQAQKLDQVHRNFIQVASLMMEQSSVKADMVRCLSRGEKLAENMLRIQSMEWPLLVSQQSLTELAAIVTLRQQLEDKKNKAILLPLNETLKFEEGEHDVSTFLQIQRLVLLQQQLPNLDEQNGLKNQLFQLRLSTASLARKQSNFNLAEELLLCQIGTMLKDTTENGRVVSTDALLPALTRLHTPDRASSQLDILKVEREGAKLLHSIGQNKDSINILSSSVVGYICSDLQVDLKDKVTLTSCSELSARSLLTLVKWLQIDYKMLVSVAGQLKLTGASEDKVKDSNVSALVHNLNLLLETEERGAKKKLGLVLEDSDQELRIGDNPILSDIDSVVGRILHLGTMESATLSKAWFSLASWCYKWGRKAVDNASHGSVELLTDEKAEVLSLLPKGTSNEETAKVLSVLSQIHTQVSNEEDIGEQDQDVCDEGTETTRKQLLSCCLSLQIASDECIEALLNVWRGVVHRVYHYYQLSAKAYFTYLQLNGMTEKIQGDEDGNVIATLRLLRLLVKHAWELRNVLESGLASTHTAPWKGIIPQLFSRLSHPESYVRQSISDLLCRVAQDAPHLIVYPAVVGSSSTDKFTKEQNRNNLLNNYLAEQLEEGGEEEQQSQEEEGEEEDPSTTMLQNCLTSIVDTLAVNNPRMIGEVKQLVQELRRITLLWDELWLGTLNQQHQDVSRKLSQLDAEVKKVMANSSLTKDEKLAIIKEKHRTIMKPTLYTMEKLQEITSEVPETPHEEWFHDTYGKLINAAMEKLRNPTNPSHPNSSWQHFKQLHSSLQQRAQKRSSLILKMEKISPKLASLKNTVIAMPGLGTSGRLVTVESVSNTLQILPTKTKPKKLVFIGSDGKKYPYLFKGLEDLHLDERIMQFLSIVNNMFASASNGDQQLYRARHYSVTPLGPRSGLIQWVDGASPLFGLYKRWQQRDALAQANKSGSVSSSTQAAQQPSIARPSDIFYNKLTPALRDKGVTNLENRKEWPLSVLRTVLQELKEETPGDLLARELWCHSTGSNEWWHVTQTYARSTAVMSMIGYIIGLGDRHLDNVLVDLATGEVVHIDYNVCFEKGKGLRVPEKVPFRMTQNIEMALGVTGIEGTFRIASEHVMKTMRKGRETLLTLLEAFVYDPLVDWTTGNEGGYTGAFYGGGISALSNAGEGRQTKHEMEREITTSMFAIRMAEMKASWQKNRDEMVAALPKLQQQVQGWLGIAQAYYTNLSSLQSMKDLKELLSEALTDLSSTLFSLKDRYDEYMVVKTTRDSVNEVMREKIEEFTHWQELHKHVIQTLQSHCFQKMCANVTNPPGLGAPSFAAATEFLQGAGQNQIVLQCEQLETEMTGYMQLQRSNLHHAIDVLHTYATIVSQFGTTFSEQNRTCHYLCWLQELKCDFASERCTDIVSEFHDLYGNPVISPAKIQLILNTETKLQAISADINVRIVKLIERRSTEATETSVLELQIEENSKALQCFVQENGSSGCCSLMAWIIAALCTLNKRYNQMEGAAAGAGDRLMDLTSRDGDWFLDELCSMSSNIMHYIDMLKINTLVGSLEHFKSLDQALMSTHNVYIALQELNMNFRTIILPEALKAIQGAEPSVCSALEDMERMFAEASHPLETMVSQLEILHRNAIMGMENDSMEMMTAVKRMRLQYNDLLEGQDVDSKELSPGQMLLMGFNGLFTRLEHEFSDLMEAMDYLQVPDVWRKVDAVREGKSMQLSSFTRSTRGYLSSLFFIKRLQAMREFFHMCTQFAVNLQGLEGGNCFDDEQLSKPIKKFIAEYVRKQVIGFPSQILGYLVCVFVNALGLNVTAEIDLKDVGAESKVPLEDLRKKAVDVCLRNGQFQHLHFTQASALTNTLDTSWRRHDLARRLDSNIEVMKASLQRAHLQLTRLLWLHEDAFSQGGRHVNTLAIPNRSTVMSEMRKCMQSLVGQETGFSSCQARYAQLEASIIQRLKWAAGANPSLNLILQQFEEDSTYRKQLYEDESKQCTEVVSLCQGILHLEALRTRTPEALTSDTNFLNLINRCNESCLIAASTDSTVTELEILLMSTKPPSEEERTNHTWLQECHEDITEQITLLKQEVDTLKKEMDISKDNIKKESLSIRGILSTHHKLMSEIRTILKSMAKQEEQDMGDLSVAGSVREYLSVYKNFSENFTTALKIVITEDVLKEGMAEADSIIDSLITQVSQIYDDLVNLAPPLLSLEDNQESADYNFMSVVKKSELRDMPSPCRKSIQAQRDTSNTPPYSSQAGALAKITGPVSTKKPEKLSRDPRTGKAIQERNSYAVSVWRRVKMKLDGRDPDINKRLSVAEQVDFVIKEATNLDNLSVLYEGWTPWV
ncbi:serine/threonine-protein kinase SMG1-like [Mizuhopecten yessoensis]|uniref:non-specific serine/threonine protein kinase n=1 Tax=Mizuhopecten yessoensis TaxID=6573 RepID=A0A210PN01_MIZYE|nr:serine/threonine-protein kinase SMG1-like [Mizuhopecten yessoensis]OWF37806.1 Serine/threonine-protein kinase SMG1 [Mizuhopecten yessoensis]